MSVNFKYLKASIELRRDELKNCGANKPGGGGFSTGNTCARGGGSSEGSATYKLEKEPHFLGETLSVNGVLKKAESYAVVYGGEKIGNVRNYKDYKDTKVPGQTYVTSRKDIVRWQATVNEGYHQVKWHPADSTPKRGPHTEMNLSSKQAALEMVQKFHKKS